MGNLGVSKFGTKDPYEGIFPQKMAYKLTTFAETYIITGDALGAAVAAGCTNGSRHHAAKDWLARPDVQKFIALKAKERADTFLNTKYGTCDPLEWVETMKVLTQMCFGKPMPVLEYNEKKGGLAQAFDDKVTNCPSCNADVSYKAAMYRFDSNGANKSMELLGKHMKLLTDKIEISSEVTPEMIQNALTKGAITSEELSTYFRIDKILKSLSVNGGS